MIKQKVLTVPSLGLLMQIAFWIVTLSFIIGLSAVVLGWPEAFFRSVLIITCHLVNFYFFYSYLVPRYFERGKYIDSLFGFLILMMVITPLRMGIENLFVPDLSVIRVRVGTETRIGFVIFSEVTIAGFASLLRLAVNREHLKLQMKDLEKSKLETELRFLKGQMSPHFLFNSINNIYSLVLLKSDFAPTALLKLSALLRYLLYECDHKVSISKEVEALKTYSDLFQLKFEQPLKLTWDIKIVNTDRCIEPLTLVPLLENAMKHSGLGTDLNSEVRFAIHSDEQKLMIKTENSVSKSDIQSDSGGIGLTNIQKRLEKTFPGNYKLEISQSQSWFSLYLEMPLL